MTPPPDQDWNARPTGAGSLLATAKLPKLEITLRLPDILRGLGYPQDTAPSQPVIESVERLMGEAGDYLRPRGTYSLYVPAAWTDRSLNLGGATIAGNVREFFRGARRIAVFMVTVGDEITQQATMRDKAGDAFAGRVLDIAGSWAAELTAQALTTHLASHLGPDESFTQRHSPGFCGMELAQQRVLFRLVPADAIGITLLPSLFMHPLKSMSGLIGLGPRAEVGEHLSPCEPCPLVDCPMRQQESDGLLRAGS